MTATREDASMAYFDFECPGCHSAGELGVSKAEGMQPFGCPDGCGAMFVMWRPNKELQLRCVVQPFFEDAHA